MWTRMRRIPFAIWVISGGLLYSALALAYLTIPFALAAGIMGDSGTVLVILIFVAVFLVASVFSFRQKRWAYVLGAATSVVLVLLYSFVIVTTLSNPADAQFWLIISALPTWFLVVLFSSLCFIHAKNGLDTKRNLVTAQSAGGLLTLAVVGFVIGRDRKSTRLHSSHLVISYAVFCLKKNKLSVLRAAAFLTRGKCRPCRPGQPLVRAR